MPTHIQNLVANYPYTKESVGGFDISKQPLFVTPTVRKALREDGLAVIHNILPDVVLKELRRYVTLKMESEGILDPQAYLVMGGPRHTVGLVTKFGWLKLDYAGPIQQILAADPALYVLMCELYGLSRLMVNHYEYKVSYPRRNTGGKFYDGVQYEFMHAGMDTLIN
jgi:hypothetical protein